LELQAARTHMPGPDDDVAEGTPVLLTATFLLFF